VLPIPFVPKGPAYRDNEDKVRLESRNGIIQAKFVLHKVSEWSQEERVTPELVLKLQELAITQIYRCAGYFRDGLVTIGGSDHQPPDAGEVQMLVSQMCDYINNKWHAPPFIWRLM
jgi:hypothetical protein